MENKHKLINTLDRQLKEMMIGALENRDDENINFFAKESTAMGNLANSAFQDFLILCDSNPELAKDNEEHYGPAKNSLASELGGKIPTILHNNKEDLLPFITNASVNKKLNELVIRGANFDNKWHTLIHDTMPTATAGSST